jgi:ABC-type lipoprotein release transport system permease subunit
MKINFLLAWRNLWRQPRRTWLTTGAMIFSNMILVFLLSMQLGMYQLMIDSGLRPFTGHIQVQQTGYLEDQKLRQTVPAVSELAASLRKSLDLETISPRAAAFALASSAERSYGVQVLGVDPEHEALVSTVPGLIREGRYLRDKDAAEVVIGEVLARNLKAGVGDELTLLGSGLDGSFAAGVATLVGIFRSGIEDMDRGAIEIPLGYFQDTFAMGDAGHSVVILAPNLFRVPALTESIATALANDAPRSGPRLAVLDWDTLQPGLRQSIQGDLASAFFSYIVLVALVSFSMLNTQLMSVLERTREFGVIMALGVGPGQLGKVVLIETLLMGVIGAVLGAALGLALLFYFGTVGLTFPGLEEIAGRYNLPGRIYPQFSWVGLLLGPAMVLLGSLLATLYPAFRMRKVEPVDAMRSV